jgi:hypothetical protein
MRPEQTGSTSLRLFCCVLAGSFLTSLRAQQPVDVFCSPPTPVVHPPETVRVRAWATTPAGETLTYRWAATAGVIEKSGSEVDWTIKDQLADSRTPYRATVRADGSGGSTGTCTIELLTPLAGRGPAEREAGKMLLVKGRHPASGYGLYSFIVLGSGVVDASRERYRKTIEAWWSLVPDVLELEGYFAKSKLNAIFLPVLKPAPAKVSVDWLLENYDYARARVILQAVGRSGRDGPYLISSFTPLSERSGAGGRYLFQDLSSIPPSLATAWMKEFVNQSAQERFWEERTAAVLGLRMRTTVRILGVGLPEIQASLGQWIRWVAGAGDEGKQSR